jgi:hypothetical protein
MELVTRSPVTNINPSPPNGNPLGWETGGSAFCKDKPAYAMTRPYQTLANEYGK